jgi:hypothetical protein
LHSFTQHDQHVLCPPTDKPLLLQRSVGESETKERKEESGRDIPRYNPVGVV